MNEFDIIREFFSGASAEDLVVGVGDDAAVVSVGAGQQLVTCVDTLVEGVHFLPSMDPADLGYHLAAVNISDMAAMAADPRWALLSLTLRDNDAGWMRGFSEGLHAAFADNGIALIGGDTTQSVQCTLSLNLLGEVPIGEALCRSGAGVGDGIYVTGNPGDAAAGLEHAMRGEPHGDLYSKFARPQSRIAYGRQLRRAASAAIDISDGLFADLNKLLVASKKGAELHIDRLPLSDAMLRYVSHDEGVAFGLSGGDDYELLFTASSQPPDDGVTPVRLIGHVTDGPSLRCFDQGKAVEYDDQGYLHFQ